MSGRKTLDGRCGPILIKTYLGACFGKTCNQRTISNPSTEQQQSMTSAALIWAINKFVCKHYVITCIMCYCVYICTLCYYVVIIVSISTRVTIVEIIPNVGQPRGRRRQMWCREFQLSLFRFIDIVWRQELLSRMHNNDVEMELSAGPSLT